MSTVDSTMTTAELLAMPEDGMERELIRGHLKEREMTKRNRRHAATEAKIAAKLVHWIDANSGCKLHVLSGEAGCVLTQNPDTTVGIDVAVFSEDTLQNQTSDTTLVVGVPVLAVEILSPSDRHEDTRDKINEYLRVGVQLVWEVDPDFKTVTVYRPNAEPVMFNRTQTITGDEVLPNLNLVVQDFFPAWDK